MRGKLTIDTLEKRVSTLTQENQALRRDIAAVSEELKARNDRHAGDSTKKILLASPLYKSDNCFTERSH